MVELFIVIFLFAIICAAALFGAANVITLVEWLKLRIFYTDPTDVNVAITEGYEVSKPFIDFLHQLITRIFKRNV